MYASLVREQFGQSYKEIFTFIELKKLYHYIMKFLSS